MYQDLEIENIEDAKHFHYRKNDRVQDFLVLTINGNDYYLRKRENSQFYSLLGLKKWDVLNMHDYEERSAIILSTFKNKETKIILKMVDDKVFAVVSEYYTTIPHSHVWAITREIIKPNSESDLRRTPKLVWKIFYMDEDPDFKVGLAVFNSCKGRASLSIRKYWEIKVCSNGMFSQRIQKLFARRHVGESEKILTEFKGSLESLMKSSFIGLFSDLKDMKEVGEKTVFESRLIAPIIKRLELPAKSRDYLFEKRDDMNNFWDVSNAISFSANLLESSNQIFDVQLKACKVLQRGVIESILKEGGSSCQQTISGIEP